MINPIPTGSRPLITLTDGIIKHNFNETARVVVRRNLISIGCTDITPEAARHVLAQWDKHYGNKPEPTEVLVQ